ncbi:MAG: cupin domain-containing protein [Duncaniella sp.]|nr:cupin domain-containing protein [Duncaniella sp.]
MLKTDFKFGEVNNLSSQIEMDSERPSVKHIFSNGNGGVSLLALKSGQKLDEHLSPAELMVTVLEGDIVFTMMDKPHVIHAGEFMLVGEGVLHSVEAKADSKVLLTKIKA